MIEGAAERQAEYVRKCRIGEYAKLADRLLYEIEEAKLCLLNPQLRKEYEEKLGRPQKRPLKNAAPQAGVHVFRKTSLQYAHDGEDEKSEAVALDAGVSKSVLLKHCVKPNLWRKSNRTYCRLLASLPGEIARLYGHEESEQDRLQRELEVAKGAGNWFKVAEIANAPCEAQPSHLRITPSRLGGPCLQSTVVDTARKETVFVKSCELLLAAKKRIAQTCVKKATSSNR